MSDISFNLFDEPLDGNSFAVPAKLDLPVAPVGNKVEPTPVDWDYVNSAEGEDDGTDELTKKINSLTEEMNAIRRLSDNRRINIKEISKRKDPFVELKREYEKKLREALDNIRALEDEINAENAGIVTDHNEIDKLSKLQAELIAQRQAAKGTKDLVRFIERITKDFEPWAKAWEHQKEDIVFTIQAWRDGRNGVLNANDMSLGKTFETIVSLWIIMQEFSQLHGRAPRVLWLTKSSLVPETPKEIRYWVPEWKVFPIQGKKSPDVRQMATEMALRKNGIVVCNYEVPRTTPLVRNTEWDLVVIDEVHKLKGGANSNGPTAVWEIVKQVCRKSAFTFMLSGTPIVAKPEEMWSYLHIFKPEKFPDPKSFRNQFGVVKGLELHIDPNKLLHGALKGQMFRRTLEEVGGNMPELRQIVRNLEMPPAQLEAYESMRRNFFVWLDKQAGKAVSSTAVIAQLIRLRQINAWPGGIKLVDPDTKEVSHLDVNESSKIEEAMDIIEELVDAGENVVVSCTFNEPLFEIQRRCEAAFIPCETLTGANSDESDQLAERFRQLKGRVLAINSSMGEGLNLHVLPERWPAGGRTVIHLDKWYTPARNEQVEGRVYRKGITQACTVYYLRNENSVDNFIDAILAERLAMIGDIANSEVLRPSGDWKQYLEGMI